jgi:hypothetical protein
VLASCSVDLASACVCRGTPPLDPVLDQTGVLVMIYDDHELQFLKIYQDNCSIVMIRRQICEQHSTRQSTLLRPCMKRTAEDLFSTPTNSSNTATTTIRRTIYVNRLSRNLATRVDPGRDLQGAAANVEDLRHRIGELSSQLALPLPLDSSNDNHPVLELDWHGKQLDKHESAFFESLSQLGDHRAVNSGSSVENATWRFYYKNGWFPESDGEGCVRWLPPSEWELELASLEEVCACSVSQASTKGLLDSTAAAVRAARASHAHAPDDLRHGVLPARGEAPGGDAAPGLAPEAHGGRADATTQHAGLPSALQLQRRRLAGGLRDGRAAAAAE